MNFSSSFLKSILAALLALQWMMNAANAQTPVATPTPAPIPASVVPITFNGVTKFRESELRDALDDQIQTINESGLNAASADDAAFFLGIFYHNHGYSQAEIKWAINAGTLVLNVSEGPPAMVQEVTFTGNASIPSTKLRDFLVGATRERLSMLKQTLPYIAADIETGVERVRGLYLSEGFLESTVDPPEIKFSQDKTRVLINVNVHEGRQYHFGKLNFSGDLVFRPISKVEEELKPFTDKPYTPAAVTNMQRKLVYFYRVRGYFDVKVDAVSDPASAKDGLVPVNFTVESGSIYRFGGVNITGLDKLKAGFLPQRFSRLRGKFYDPTKLDEVYRDMVKTGLFKSLRITSTPLPSHEVELNMEVEEADSKEIGFALGYGTFEGPIIGLRLGDRDLFGNGRPISATFELSAKLIKGELTYTDPWFLETDNKLKLRLYTLNQDWDGYSKVETGFKGELSRQLTKTLEGTVFILSRQVKITNEDIYPPDLGDTNYMVNSLGVAFTLDLREKTKSAATPGKGLIVKASGELATSALGSTINYLRGTVGAAYYIPIKKTLLAFGARGGVISPLNGDSLPIDERFFNGGGQSVRSFAERKLGPTDPYGNPIGGEVFTIFNAEYTFPLVGDLDMALFTDAGSVGSNLSDGIGELRYAVGTGLRYKLPIGPLRLDYGYNPTRKSGESTGAVHFSFGFAF